MNPNMEHHFNSVAEADQHAPVQPAFSTLKRSLISATIVLYFWTIALWISTDGPFKWACLSVLRPAIVALGIGQSWNLFSPNIRTMNLHMNAIITFTDGSEKLYEFPRMEELDLWGRFQKEKMRKLFIDVVPWNGYEEFLPAVARFIARGNLNPANPPVSVTLSKSWTWMPKPDPDHWVTRDAFPLHGLRDAIFVYQVEPKDLQ